jgi:hypothetical protein
MEIIKFTPKIYAVKGAKTEAEALMAVIRKKKAAKSTAKDYITSVGYVGDYGKDELGLWVGGLNRKTNCFAVRKVR